MSCHTCTPRTMTTAFSAMTPTLMSSIAAPCRMRRRSSRCVRLPPPPPPQPEPPPPPVIDEPSGPPEELVCPLTHELMVDPVILMASGQTYERAPLERWLATHDTDPMTGAQLTTKLLAENVLVRSMCRKYNAWQLRASMHNESIRWYICYQNFTNNSFFFYFSVVMQMSYYINDYIYVTRKSIC